MLNIKIITLFPELFGPHLETFPVSKAVKSSLIEVDLINLRDFGDGVRKTVDDKLYGGGTGMLLKPEPILKAIEKATNENYSESKFHKEGREIVFLTPKGTQFNSGLAKEFSKLTELIIICGRYEGIDQRIIEAVNGKELSIGPFVLAGGEVAAMAVLESSVRFVPGVLQNEAYEKDSFEDGTLEHPQYTRPEEFLGIKVPETLITGHHKNIEDWRKSQSKKIEK